MIARFYNTSFIIKRQVWSSKKTSLKQVGVFDGHIQQGTDKQLTEDLGLSFTKTFTVWCAPETDITEGDRIDGGSAMYDVRYAVDRNIGTNGHKMLVVEKNG